MCNNVPTSSQLDPITARAEGETNDISSSYSININTLNYEAKILAPASHYAAPPAFDDNCNSNIIQLFYPVASVLASLTSYAKISITRPFNHVTSIIVPPSSDANRNRTHQLQSNHVENVTSSLI